MLRQGKLPISLATASLSDTKYSIVEIHDHLEWWGIPISPSPQHTYTTQNPPRPAISFSLHCYHGNKRHISNSTRRVRTTPLANYSSDYQFHEKLAYDLAADVANPIFNVQSSPTTCSLDRSMTLGDGTVRLVIDDSSTPEEDISLEESVTLSPAFQTTQLTTTRDARLQVLNWSVNRNLEIINNPSILSQKRTRNTAAARHARVRRPVRVHNARRTL